MLYTLHDDYFMQSISIPRPTSENTLSSCDNYLYINGESNVNQFSFRYDMQYLRKTKAVFKRSWIL